MSDRESKALPGRPNAFPQTDGFGKPGGPIRPPLRQANPAVSPEVDVLLPGDPGQGQAIRRDLKQDVKRIAARLRPRYAEEMQRDPRGFKKRVCSLIRRYLPPFAGRPTNESVTSAIGLRELGLEWKAIYPQVMPNHVNLDSAVRRQVQSNLRAAVRSRGNAAKRRKRRQQLLAETTHGPIVPSRQNPATTLTLRT